MTRRLLTICSFVVCLSTHASSATSAPAIPPYVDNQAKLLGSMPPIEVIVEAQKADAEKDGLTASMIKAYTVERLQNSKIKILTGDGSPLMPAAVFLDVAINPVKNGDGMYGYSINVSLNEVAVLVRKPQISCTVISWERGLAGTIPSSKLPEITRGLGEVLDLFTSDYFAANLSSVAEPDKNIAHASSNQH